MFSFAGLPPGAAQLTTQVFDRLFKSFRPSTQRTYSRTFGDHLVFLVVSWFPPGQVNVDNLLAFLEYLHQNNLTVSMTVNCMLLSEPCP